MVSNEVLEPYLFEHKVSVTNYRSLQSTFAPRLRSTPTTMLVE